MAPEYKDRVSARTKVTVEGFYSYSNQWVPCVVHDLSMEGAGLKINQILVPGDTLQLKFLLRSDERIIDATVANGNGTRTGVRFVADVATQAFLQALIQAHHRPTSFRRHS